VSSDIYYQDGIVRYSMSLRGAARPLAARQVDQQNGEVYLLWQEFPSSPPLICTCTKRRKDLVQKSN